MIDPAKLRTACLIAVFVTAIHLILTVQYFDHPLEYDEAYHLLAAQSWNEDGSLRILDGQYTRAALWTKVTGVAMSICGTTEICARTPALLFSCIWVGLIAFTGARWFGATAGFVAGLLAALSPPIVVAAHTVRFYSLHGLLIFVVAILLFQLVQKPRGRLRLAALTAGCGVFLAIAYHLQVTTIVAIVSLLAAAGILWLPKVWRLWSGLTLRGQLLSLGLLLGFMALMLLSIDAQRYLSQWQTGPAWSEGLAGNLLYYHHIVKEWFPLLWAGAPALIILAASREPARTVYLITAFAVSFVIFSTAFAKGARYIMYALPFLYLPLGYGVGIALNGLFGAINKTASIRLNRYAGPVALAAVVSASLFAALMQPIVPAAMRVALQPGYQRWFGYYDRYPDWIELGPRLRDTIDQQPFVLTTSGPKTALVAGRYDMELYYSKMFETDTRDEFGVDPRTGRPVISSAASLERVLDENPQGIFIAERHYFSSDLTIRPDARQVLLERTTEIESPDPKMVIRVW